MVRVSVIIPAYNAQASLGDTLASFNLGNLLRFFERIQA